MSSTSVCSKCRNQSVKCHVYDQSLIVLCRLLFSFGLSLSVFVMAFVCCHLLPSVLNVERIFQMINFLVVFFRLVFVFLSPFERFCHVVCLSHYSEYHLQTDLADSLAQYILFDTNRNNTLFLIYKFNENNVWHDIYNYCVLINNLVT